MRLAASKMNLVDRRSFQASMTVTYCKGKARLAESRLGWGRESVELGLAERRTGIVCIGAQSGYSGAKRWEDRYPAAAAQSIPCGILDEDSGQLYLNFGCSYKTSDFIVDNLQTWWNGLSASVQAEMQGLQLKIDNGPESSGIRTQFLILEQHWNGTLLRDLQTLLAGAKSMTWKGIHPILQENKTIYRKGIALSKQAMREVERRLERNPELPKWDILIQLANR